MKKTLGALLIASVLAPPVAKAEVTVGLYRSSAGLPVGDQARFALESYVSGVTIGYMMLNQMNGQLGGMKLFCPPLNTRFDMPQVLQIINEDLRSTPSADDESIEFVIMMALSRKYPCSALD